VLAHAAAQGARVDPEEVGRASFAHEPPADPVGAPQFDRGPAPVDRRAAIRRSTPIRLRSRTDMGRDPDMYRLTFRILETLDEHYAPRFEYHWSYSGFGLDESVLKKLYQANPQQLARSTRTSLAY
jgi:hypothetical protein